MRHTIIIFLKELKETLRERRTLISMIFVPLLLYPLMFILISKVSRSQTEKSMEKVVKVAMINGDEVKRLQEDFELDEGYDLISPDELAALNGTVPAADNDSILKNLIREGKLDVVIWADTAFNRRLDSLSAGVLWFYYNSTSNNVVQKRVEGKIQQLETLLTDKRYKDLGIDRSMTEVLTLEKRNVASKKEILGKLIGGFLPYLFIIIAFTGSMYPALDLAAGEKERGTIETILTTPAAKIEIIFGKTMVVMLTGLTSAIISVFGILISLRFLDTLPPELISTIYSIMEPQAILMLLLMMLPLTLLFASVLLSISIYARSFKEAQSMVTPMIMVIIFPAVFGMLPGVELNATTALIPIVNISLITKEIMAGTLNYLYFAEAMLSLLGLALLAFVFSLRWFGREDVIMR